MNNCKSSSWYTKITVEHPVGHWDTDRRPLWFSATSPAAVLVVVEQGAARRPPCSHSSSHRHCLPFATCCCMFTRVCVGRPGEQENMFPVRRKVWDVTAAGMNGSGPALRNHGAAMRANHRWIGAFMPIHCLLARRRPARLTA